MSERSVNVDSGSYLTGYVTAVIDIWANMLGARGFVIERQPLRGFGDQFSGRQRAACRGWRR